MDVIIRVVRRSNTNTRWGSRLADTVADKQAIDAIIYSLDESKTWDFRSLLYLLPYLSFKRQKDFPSVSARRTRARTTAILFFQYRAVSLSFATGNFISIIDTEGKPRGTFLFAATHTHTSRWKIKLILVTRVIRAKWSKFSSEGASLLSRSPTHAAASAKNVN